MHTDSIAHVGLDVHARTIAVALADGHGLREVRSFGQIVNEPQAIEAMVRQLAAAHQATPTPRGRSSRKPAAPAVTQARPIHFWYEAGPCGYGLWRQLTAMGHACSVVAPSLIPRKAGDRVKTDRRDAMSLARLGRAGELTSVWVPAPEHEAMRDLTRCREDAKEMQRKARQQLGGFLLRHGRRFNDGDAWTGKHHQWLTSQRFASPVQETVFQDYLGQVDQLTARVDELDAAIRKAAMQWSLWPVVEGLMAMRGVNLIVAVTMMAEVGDLTRFDSPRQLMSYLGLVPSEHSSGMSTRRGGITKAGNSHARRVLVEAAWSYRFAARMTKHLKAKARHAPQSVQAIAWKAQRRLCGRYRQLIDRAGKLKVVACTAIAREMCGFMWAIAWEVHRLQQRASENRPRGRSVLETGGPSSGTLDVAMRQRSSGVNSMTC